jgi:hypothetical protein
MHHLYRVFLHSLDGQWC